MSSDVQRVSFRFGHETEVHYLTRVPEVGDHVTRGRELWIIAEVRTHELGVVATCEDAAADSDA